MGRARDRDLAQSLVAFVQDGRARSPAGAGGAARRGCAGRASGREKCDALSAGLGAATGAVAGSWTRWPTRSGEEPGGRGARLAS